MTSTISSTQTIQPLDVPTAIQQRRSIKLFKPDPIAPELLQQLIELTVAAPSSFNLQDWKIIIVQDPDQRAALAAASWNQAQIAQAPVTVVFATQTTSWSQDLDLICETGITTGAWTDATATYFKSSVPKFQESLGEKQREYGIKDAMIAATHLVLAAESLGLATCFMNGWIEDQVKAVIGASGQDDLAIAVLVPVGYAAEPRKNPGRLPLTHNVSVDRLDTPYSG
jgi:nitroreductase